MSSPPLSDEVKQPRCYTATRVTRPPSNPTPPVKAPTLCRSDDKDARVPAPSTLDHHNPPLLHCCDCNGHYPPCRLARPNRILLCGACTTQYTPSVPAARTLHGDGSGFSVYTEAPRATWILSSIRIHSVYQNCQVYVYVNHTPLSIRIPRIVCVYAPSEDIRLRYLNFIHIFFKFSPFTSNLEHSFSTTLYIILAFGTCLSRSVTCRTKHAITAELRCTIRPKLSGAAS
jgi:hypothetical protein